MTKLHTALTIQAGPLQVQFHTSLRGEWTEGWQLVSLPTNARTRAFAGLVLDVHHGKGYYGVTERWEERPSRPLNFFSEVVSLAQAVAWSTV